MEKAETYEIVRPSELAGPVCPFDKMEIGDYFVYREGDDQRVEMLMAASVAKIAAHLPQHQQANWLVPKRAFAINYADRRVTRTS